MDEFTKWDDGVLGPGTYTSWDDINDGPNETKWDVIPSVIARAVRVVWTISRQVKWVRT